jgi:hypothetical protein
MLRIRNTILLLQGFAMDVSREEFATLQHVRCDQSHRFRYSQNHKPFLVLVEHIKYAPSRANNNAERVIIESVA